MKRFLLACCLLWAPLALAQDDVQLLAEWKRLTARAGELEALVAPIASDQPLSVVPEQLMRLEKASYDAHEVLAELEGFVEVYGATVEERLAQHPDRASGPLPGELLRRVRAASEAIPRLQQDAAAFAVSKAEAALAKAQENPDGDPYGALEESLYVLELVTAADCTDESADAVRGGIHVWLEANAPVSYPMECGTADLVREREVEPFALIALAGSVLLALVIGGLVVASGRWRLV